MNLQSPRPNRRWHAVAAVCLGVVAAIVSAAPASAEYGITQMNATPSTTQAGAHGDLLISYDVTVNDEGYGGLPFLPPGPTEDMRTLRLEMPPGLIAEAARFPSCTRAQFTNATTPCPRETQVGTITVRSPLGIGGVSHGHPIYNLDPAPDKPAALGVLLANAPLVIDIGVRTGEGYGLIATTNNAPGALPVTGLDISLWGVPADASHDTDRFPCSVDNAMNTTDTCPVAAPRRPFMMNPTSCGDPATFGIAIQTYQTPGRWVRAETSLPALTGCESLAFDPAVSMRPTNPVADQPSGLEVGIAIPRNPDPDGLATPAVREVAMQLPDGVTINPSLAFDRSACADDAFGLRNGGASSCPAGSKIGTIAIDVPALRQPLPGDIYLGTPRDGNPFRLFLYAEGQGTRVKLEGSILPDPKTGRILALFSETPQVPFTAFNLRFVGGPRAALTMPPTCGVKTGVATLRPYSRSTAVGLSPGFSVFDHPSGACPEKTPFAPTFTAGVLDAAAGRNAPFVVSFGRPDGHQSLSRLQMRMPAGVLGRLAAFPLCPNAQADAGTCGEESMVGGVKVAAGSGSSPLMVPGRVFLTEPPKPGQIAGLSIVVPAIAGPYNLGTPVVRAGITVNRDTSLSVESDPLPTILAGVPLRIQQVVVSLDHPDFMFNPTDCSPKVITGALTSVDGAEVGVESPFGVSGCADLPFSPGAAMSMPAPSKDGGNTGLTFRLLPNAGDADLRQVQVVLPSGVGARLDGPLQTQCTGAAFEQDACGPQSKVGRATATTPVLPQPLAGDAFFLENGTGSGLPKLAIRLKGAVTIDLVGDVAITPSGRVVTTFAGIPDVPISGFELALDTTGPNAPLTAAGVCRKKAIAGVSMIAHSGKQFSQQVGLDVTGCKAASKSKKAKKAKGAVKKGKKGRAS